MELQRRRVQSLMDMITVVEWLFNYDIAFPTSIKSNGGASHSSGRSNGWSGRSSKSKSGGGSNESAL